MAEPVNFESCEGEHIAIVGPNGGGKSMFVDIIVGRHPLLMHDPDYDFSPSTKTLVSDNIKYITFRDTYGGDNDRTYFLQQRWNQLEIDENTPIVKDKLEEAYGMAGEDTPERRALQKHIYELFHMEHLLDKYTILLSSGESIWDIKKHIGYVSPELHRSYQRDLPAIRIVASGLMDSVGLYVKPKEEDMGKCRFWMKVFGLEAEADTLADNLPYGKQRKLEIARALATKPKLLLLDEPAAGMNPNETQELMDTIRFVREHFDMTILLIEHDMKLVSGICEELTVLNFGRVLCQGKTSDVLNNPEVIKAYLGE